MAFFPDNYLLLEGQYNSREALVKVINTWASTRGYAFVIVRSTREKSGKCTITYYCDRNHRPPNYNLQRQRKTTTRTTNCLFSMLTKESLDKITWILQHKADQKFSLHSHNPSFHLIAHLAHRTLQEEDLTIITL